MAFIMDDKQLVGVAAAAAAHMIKHLGQNSSLFKDDT
jgi:hypothetical protein